MLAQFSRTVGLQDTEDLVTGHEADLGDAMGVAEGDTDLRGGETLTGEFYDVVDDIVGGRLEPCRGCAAVGESGGRYGGCEMQTTMKLTATTYKCPFRERACDPWLAAEMSATINILSTTTTTHFI